MNCTQARELMSGYFDGELPEEQRAVMASHFELCESCHKEIDIFQQLSALAKATPTPVVAQDTWRQIESQLDAQGSSSPSDPRNEIHETASSRSTPHAASWKRPLGWAMAASLLLLVGWLGYRTWFGEEQSAEHEFEAVFAEYLTEFRNDPVEAQQVLLRNYRGVRVDPKSANQSVGYQPVVARGVPPEYSIESTYVMTMPCCTCVQCVCKHEDGSTIVIFEHDDAESHWFGDREKRQEICAGKTCEIVGLNDSIAATWQQGNRHLTVVGLKNTRQVDELVAWFE